MSDHSKYTSGFNANNSCVDSVVDTADVDDAGGSISLSNYKLGLECIKNIAKKVKSFGRRAEEDEQLELFHITPDDVANVSEASNTNREEFTALEDNIDDSFEDCTNDNGLSNEDHTSNTTYLRPPPEVTTTVPLAVEASSNYLSLKSRATPGDRGDDDLIECKLDIANRHNVNVDSISDNNLFYTSRDSHRSRIGSNPEEREGNEANNVTSSGLPVADLREAEGEVNRRAPCNGKDSRTLPQVESCLQDDERLIDNEGIKISSVQKGSSMMDEFDDEVKSDGQLYKMVAVFNDDGCLDRFVLKDLNMKDEKIGCSKWLSRTLNRDDSSLNITDVGLLNKVNGNNYNSVLDNNNNSDDLKSTNNDSKLISEVKLGQFTSRIEEITHKFHNVIKSNIEEGFEKYLHDNVFKNINETFNKLYETSTNLEVRFEEKIEGFEKRLDGLYEKLEDNFNGLEDKFNKLEEVSLKLSGRFEDNFNGLEDKFKKMDKVSLKLSGRFEDNFNGLEDKFNKLEEVSLKLSEKFEDNFNGLEDKFNKLDKVSSTVLDKFIEMNDMSCKFTDNYESVTNKLNDLKEDVNNSYDRLDEFIKTLDDKLKCLDTKVDISINDMNNKISLIINNFINKLDELNDIDLLVTSINGISNNINDIKLNLTNMNNNTDDLSFKLNEINLTTNKLNDRFNIINEKGYTLTNTQLIHDKLNELENRLNTTLDKFNELNNQTNNINNLINSIQNNLNQIHNKNTTLNSTVGLADSSPPEVTTTVPLAVEASSNYLPVNGRATPGDRGGSEGGDGILTRKNEDVQPLRTGILPGGTKSVNPEEREGMDVTSSGTPVADLREAKGELNRGGTTPSGKTTSGETPTGKELDGRFYGINDGFHSGYVGTPGGCRIIGSACSPMVYYDESYVNTPNMDVSWVSINGRMVKHTKERISLPELAFNNSTPKNIVDINRLSQYSMTPIQITPYQSPHNYTPNNNIYNY